MLLLLFDSPCCHMSHQSKAIRTHEMPQAINELTYDLGGTRFEILFSRILRVLKCFFVNFTVAVFAPPQIL